MEESISYLLPLALLLMACQLKWSERARSNFQFEWILGCGFLFLAAVLAWMTGPLKFEGPALFVLNSSHQILFQLQADWLVLGILAAFVCLSAAAHRTNSPRSEGLLSLAVALFLLSDNFGLQFLAGAWLLGLIVIEQVRRDESIGIDAGLGLFSMLLLLLCLGLLAFDIDVDSWTALSDVVTSGESLSQHELSSLKLASFLLVFSTVVLVGLAPLQAFWIRSTCSGPTAQLRGVIRYLLVIVLLHRGRGLILWAATSQFAVSLAFATFVMTAFCAPFQRDPNHKLRAMIVSHLSLAMTALLAATDVAYAAGICHALATCVVFSVLSNIPVVQSQFILGTTLSILFGGISGAFLLLSSATQAGIAFELIGLLAWMCLGLTQTRLIYLRRESPAVDVRMTSQGLLPSAILLAIAPVAFWSDCVTQLGLAPALKQVWLVPEALLAGSIGVAFAWYTRRSNSLSERISDRAPGVVRLFEGNFHLSELVSGVVRIPGGICLGFFEWGRDAGALLVRKWGEMRSKTQQPVDESVRWELIRGVVCAVALLIVFLWIDW